MIDTRPLGSAWRLSAWLAVAAALPLPLLVGGFANVAWATRDEPAGRQETWSPSEHSLPGFAPETSAMWAPAALGARTVLLRSPDLTLRDAVTRLRVKVGAAPTGEPEQRVLAAYRLFVNGQDVGIGPGRGDAVVGAPETPEPFPGSFIFDEIDVPAAVLAVGGARLSLALQCYHSDGKAAAWVLMEAHAFDEANATLGVVGSGMHWSVYDARFIFRRGRPDIGSAYGRHNEDLDATEYAHVAGWRLPGFAPTATRGWLPAERRAPAITPVAKRTAPLQVEVGIEPVELVQTAPDHWFFDFGTNRAAGWRLRVPNGTGTAWGGHGTRLEIRLGEALSAEGARTIAWANPIDAFFNGWPTSARRASQPLAPSLSRHATFTVLRAGLPSARRCIHHSYRPAFFCVRDGVVPRSHAAGT